MLIAVCTVVAGFLLGACGGGSSDGSTDDTVENTVDNAADDTADDSTPVGSDVDLEQASESPHSPAANTSDEATATVVLDGTTYEFISNPDGTLKTRTFCSSIANALQGDLLLVDESGAFVEGGEVGFSLFDPDSDSVPAGVEQSVMVTLPAAPGGVGPITYLADADTIESEVSGRSATAIFTAEHDTGAVPGSIEILC